MGSKVTYFTYQKKKKHWANVVLKSLPKALPKEPLENVHLKIHYIFPDRRKRDLDNYSGKFLIDPLVKKGILKDDNYTCISNLNISAEYKKKIRKTIIEVTEIE